jgi:hypothetical protein
MLVKNIEKSIILEGKYRENAEMGKVNLERILCSGAIFIGRGWYY